VALTPDQVLEIPGARIDCFVYDMEPGGRSAVDLVHEVHAARPDLPIWLYFPRRPAVIEGVARVASWHGVWATPQGTGPLHDLEIRVHARCLVTSVPYVRLRTLLDPILRQVPAEMSDFLARGLRPTYWSEARRFKIRDGTAGDSATLRRLERVCVAATGSGPKRLFDHLLMVLLTFKALAFDAPLQRAAEQAGLSRKDLDRLRQRVLRTDGGSATVVDPRAQFAFAVMALADVCNAPRRAAHEVLRDVAGDYQVDGRGGRRTVVEVSPRFRVLAPYSRDIPYFSIFL
jgi:hypothetical protein